MSGDPVGSGGDLARRLLLAVQAGDQVAMQTVSTALAALAEDRLAADLPDDRTRIAAWLNLYNAAAQRLVEDAPDGYGQRTRFFRRPAITVAGTTLRLDTIEHGLLRHSRPKLGLGWITHPWPSAFERRLRVERVDPRIHFALNCAAASCPPIAAYDPVRLDEQLELATCSYLGSTVRQHAGRLLLPRVFLWFAGDFGGPAGIRRFLERHGIATEGFRLRASSWDWTLAPGAWVPTDPAATEPQGPDAPVAMADVRNPTDQ